MKAESIYKFYTPTPEQAEDFQVLQAEVIKLHKLIEKLCPNARHRSLALTSLEESYLWSTRAIALDKQ